jgi:hypothetical protein
MAKTPIPEIRKKTKAYYDKMVAISSDLEKAGSPNRIIKDKEPIGFIISKTALARLNEIAAMPNCEALLVLLGLENQDTKNGITSCFVGVDSTNHIIYQAQSNASITTGGPVDPQIDGEENWPPPPPPGDSIEKIDSYTAGNILTLASDWSEIDKLFS